MSVAVASATCFSSKAPPGGAIVCAAALFLLRRRTQSHPSAATRATPTILPTTAPAIVSLDGSDLFSGMLSSEELAVFISEVKVDVDKDEPSVELADTLDDETTSRFPHCSSAASLH